MNNGDLISREAVVEWLKKVGRFLKSLENTKEETKLIGKIIDHIQAMPAVDAVEVVHAKWVNAPLCGNDNCRCSNCGSWHNIHANMRGKINYKYCPDCGSRMDGE